MKPFIIVICFIGVQAWDIDIKGPSSVQIGSAFSLSCNATNLESSPSKVVWYKDYEKVVPNDRISVAVLQPPNAITSKLSIKDAGQEDAGKYKCWVSNQVVRHFNVAVVGSAKAGGAPISYFPGLSIFMSLVFIKCFLKILDRI